MVAHLMVFLCGLLFALGLGVSGMTDANKVIGFLNLAGEWDPSLAFVMIGAIGVHMPLIWVIRRRKTPFFGNLFHLPTRQDLGWPLVGGSAIFGIGWGLGGFCPGPGIVSTMSGISSALVFSAAMLAGMKLVHLLEAARSGTKEAIQSPS
ncbi:MAG: DUF6691 family protein [Myxococcota bacterium]|nr:DUF6691 family protein [Myxococcota bacterium]MEE2779385.1 DUF6691 family protein [Myxococcota bacterium]